MRLSVHNHQVVYKFNPYIDVDLIKDCTNVAHSAHNRGITYLDTLCDSEGRIYHDDGFGKLEFHTLDYDTCLLVIFKEAIIFNNHGYAERYEYIDKIELPVYDKEYENVEPEDDFEKYEYIYRPKRFKDDEFDLTKYQSLDSRLEYYRKILLNEMYVENNNIDKSNLNKLTKDFLDEYYDTKK